MSREGDSLEVLAAGPMVTVQDRGRDGLRAFGVSGAGPMDPPAFALANALVGNAEDAAGLEFAVSGGRFRVSRPVRVAVTGGPCALQIDGRRLETGRAERLRPGETLSIGALERTVWGYLATSGGIATPPVLGARTTHLRSGLGGSTDGPCARATGCRSARIRGWTVCLKRVRSRARAVRSACCSGRRRIISPRTCWIACSRRPSR